MCPNREYSFRTVRICQETGRGPNVQDPRLAGWTEKLRTVSTTTSTNGELGSSGGGRSRAGADRDLPTPFTEGPDARGFDFTMG